MGWDMRGILGNALIGAADSANKYFVRNDVADETAARAKTAAEEGAVRARELADYNREAEEQRAIRTEERKASVAEKEAMRNLESVGENVNQAEMSADEAGKKPGSAEHFTHMADFELKSGRADLAKMHYDQADKIRDDAQKAAAARAGRGGGGGGGGGANDKAGGEVDLDAGLKHLGNQFLTPEGEVAKGGEGYAAMVYDNAIKDPRVGGDPKTALRLVREQVAAANKNASANNTSTLFELQKLSKDAIDAGKARRVDAIAQGVKYPEEAPTGSNPDSSGRAEATLVGAFPAGKYAEPPGIINNSGSQDSERPVRSSGFDPLVSLLKSAPKTARRQREEAAGK